MPTCEGIVWIEARVRLRIANRGYPQGAEGGGKTAVKLRLIIRVDVTGSVAGKRNGGFTASFFSGNCSFVVFYDPGIPG
eukprot:scaffold7634_cov417-Prasinococcus_capsulatus_cf.AAC.2